MTLPTLLGTNVNHSTRIDTAMVLNLSVNHYEATRLLDAGFKHLTLYQLILCPSSIKLVLFFYHLIFAFQIL